MSATRRGSVVLFSGGMDSTIALYHRLVAELNRGGRVYALTIDYGQRHQNEIVAAKRICRALEADLKYNKVMTSHLCVKLPMPKTGSLTGGETVHKYADVTEAAHHGGDDNSFVPYRNLVMLAVAAQWAHFFDCDTISTGLRGGFPDCTDQFEQCVGDVVFMANPDFSLTFDTPTHKSRAECLAYAKTLPGCWEALSQSLTCFEGTEPPCGHCLPCLKRAQGFTTIHETDPLALRLLGDMLGGG